MLNLPDLESPVGVAGHSVQKNLRAWVALIIFVGVQTH